MPCPACPGVHNCVSGNGPECNPYGTFIGEAPGIDEDKHKEPFWGKSGREVNEGYMPLAGLKRPDVRVTNAIRCLPDTPRHKLDLDRPPHRELLQSCAEWHLYPELERSRPKIIVPMGAFAAYAIDKDIDLELQHGIPIQTAWGTTFPMYHPAGGIHEPKKMLHIRTDWARLRKYMRGLLTLPVDKYPNPDYREIEDATELDRYLEGMENSPLAADTETARGGAPFCITLSVREGTGRLIRAVNTHCLHHLQSWLDRWRGNILFHNWLFDSEVVEEMALRFDWRQVVDTMIKVFHLGNMPQGLKALSYRELGMTMEDFDDLVTPFSRPLVLDYYRNAMAEEWSTPAEELVRDSNGSWKVYKPQGFRTKLKRFWTDYSKNEDKDVFDMWSKNWEDHQLEIQERLGPWPGKCITHVPFDKVLHYACRDADATLRLWPVIQHMERRVRRTSQERWRDAA
jgi:uracil-DNA glycosylase